MMHVAPYVIAAWIFVVGLYGLVTTRNLIHAVLCLSVMQSSTYVLLLSIGFRRNAGAPIFSVDVPPGTPAVDPVMHALTLTDIVVGATVMALVLALTMQVHRKTGSIDPHKARSISG
ncbi:MAG TPA: cation:proton antiporter subunit C [Candidatus Acidoferrales bacterium]|nr:cation:proton antiporter subunit C [Candidatus Acidoferrales bacterium]